MSFPNCTMKLDEFKRMRQELGEGEALILKFGATWCKPCQKIRPFVEERVKGLPSHVKFYEIDIDQSVELYLAFKSKRMLKGVPTMLAFSGDSENEGLIPDDLVMGTDHDAIVDFFKNVSYV